MIMKREELFLATTALEDFWDKEAKILFLGEWCLLYNRREDWQKLDHNVLDYPWNNRAEMLKAYNYCQTLYEEILPCLKIQLNNIHGTTHSIRYWEIILGSWLIRYIHALYDRYMCVKRALEITKQLRTITLAETSFTTPFDFHHFEALYIDDLFNLQLYSQVCDFLQIKVDKVQHIEIANNALWDAKERRPNRRMLFSCLKYIVRVISEVHFKIFSRHIPVWAIDIYAALKERLSIMIALGGKLMIFGVRRGDEKVKILKKSIKVDDKIRDILVEKVARCFVKDDFTKFLIMTLKHNFPVLFLEGYSDVIKIAKGYISKRPKVLLTATGFRSSTLYPFIAAGASESGTRLITIQHGGRFGTIKSDPMEYFDQRVSDEYWSWGWEKGLSKKCRPMPSMIIRNLKRKSFVESGIKNVPVIKKVLYCGNNYPRYQIMFWSNPIGPQVKEYIEWHHRWMYGLTKGTRKNTLVRLYPGNDYGWPQKEMLLDKYPGMKIDDCKLSLKKMLTMHDLIVVDNNHTVMLQSLVMNKPTILFWDPKYNELRKSAMIYYEELRRVGILYFSPEEAAQKTNDVLNRTADWWFSSEVQNVRKEFCEKFAFCTRDFASYWKRSLLKVINESCYSRKVSEKNDLYS